MTRLTAADLAKMSQHTIGADRIIAHILEGMGSQNSSYSNYPPFNIIKINDDETEIQVAVAGFTFGELEVKTENQSLIISGEKERNENDMTVYIHHGISARKFTRTWALADNVEVLGATVSDGILSVRVKRLIPEALKPKSIPITYVP